MHRIQIPDKLTFILSHCSGIDSSSAALCQRPTLNTSLVVYSIACMRLHLLISSTQHSWDASLTLPGYNLGYLTGLYALSDWVSPPYYPYFAPFTPMNLFSPEIHSLLILLNLSPRYIRPPSSLYVSAPCRLVL